MTVERAKQLINIYKNDYCPQNHIDNDFKMHTKFVRQMLDKLEEELENPGELV